MTAAQVSSNESLTSPAVQRIQTVQVPLGDLIAVVIEVLRHLLLLRRCCFGHCGESLNYTAHARITSDGETIHLNMCEHFMYISEMCVYVCRCGCACLTSEFNSER